MSVSPPSVPARGKLPVRAIALSLVAVLLVAVVALVVRGRNAAAQGAPPPGAPEAPAATAPEVTVEVAAPATLSQAIRVTGTLKTDETVTLSTKATGLVRRVTVKEGDRVRRGQLLIEIDDRDLRAQRDRAAAAIQAAAAQAESARAAVRAAEARLQQAKTGRDIKNVAADSQYRTAEQALAAARTRLSQAKSLAGIAATESDTRVSSARAALQSAKERLKTLRDGARKQERAAAEAAVNRAQAQAARMKSMLERREQLYRDKAIAGEAVDNARRDYEVALTDLDAAKQQLSLVEEGPRTEEIRVGEEAVRQAEAALQDAEANRARKQISSEDVDTAESQVRQAEASLEASKANLSQRQVNEDEIRNAEAALSQARAQVGQANAAAAQARADLRYQDELIAQCRVFSPVNGVVSKRSAQEGTAVVQMRNELMTLVASDTLYFEATAPETAMSQLRPGLAAKVELDAVPGREFAGVLREIIPVAEGTNRSVRLRISIPKPPQGLAVVGGFARATIAGRGQGASFSVPRTALVSDEGEMAVFIVEDGKAVRRPVQVADPGSSGDRLTVLSGLRGGEQVITDGAASLIDGQTVALKR
jgi:RND family efflux transporter MFP subunit